MWKTTFKTLTSNYEYSRSSRENFLLPIQMQLSEKPKTFCQFLRKQWASKLKYFWSYWLQKTCLLKCIKGLASESPLAVNVLKHLTGYRLYPFKFFKCCLPQILLGLFLNTLSQMTLLRVKFLAFDLTSATLYGISHDYHNIKQLLWDRGILIKSKNSKK